MLHSEHRGLNTYRPVSPTSVVCETSKQSLKEKIMKNMKVYTLNRINCSRVLHNTVRIRLTSFPWKGTWLVQTDDTQQVLFFKIQKKTDTVENHWQWQKIGKRQKTQNTSQKNHTADGFLGQDCISHCGLSDWQRQLHGWGLVQERTLPKSSLRPEHFISQALGP